MSVTTTVTNRSGSAMQFELFPRRHGKWLADNEAIIVPGLLDDSLNKRALAALNALVASNDVEVTYAVTDAASSASSSSSVDSSSSSSSSVDSSSSSSSSSA